MCGMVHGGDGEDTVDVELNAHGILHVLLIEVVAEKVVSQEASLKAALTLIVPHVLSAEQFRDAPIVLKLV